MRHLAIAAERIRRHIVHRAAAPTNVNGARDRYVALNAIGRSLRDQYDSLAAPIPPYLAQLIQQLDEAAVIPRHKF
jgi:hypothetical protein